VGEPIPTLPTLFILLSSSPPPLSSVYQHFFYDTLDWFSRLPSLLVSTVTEESAVLLGLRLRSGLSGKAKVEQARRFGFDKVAVCYSSK